MTDTRPTAEEAAEVLGQLIGFRVEVDRPLDESPIESLDLVEWMIVLEETYGMEVPDQVLNEIDLEMTPRRVLAVALAGSREAVEVDGT